MPRALRPLIFSFRVVKVWVNADRLCAPSRGPRKNLKTISIKKKRRNRRQRPRRWATLTRRERRRLEMPKAPGALPKTCRKRRPLPAPAALGTSLRPVHLASRSARTLNMVPKSQQTKSQKQSRHRRGVPSSGHRRFHRAAAEQASACHVCRRHNTAKIAAGDNLTLGTTSPS